MFSVRNNRLLSALLACLFSALLACLAIGDRPVDHLPETKTKIVPVSGHIICMDERTRTMWLGDEKDFKWIVGDKTNHKRIGDRKNIKSVCITRDVRITINGEKGCTFQDVGHLRNSGEPKATFTVVSDGFIETAELVVVTKDVKWRLRRPPWRVPLPPPPAP